MSSKKAKVIIMAALKGGVGKTTFAEQIGYIMSLKGKKILLIDTDSQGNLSKSLGVKKPNDEEFTIVELMYEEMYENGTKLEDYDKYIKNYSENLDFIACNVEMADIESGLSNTSILDTDGTLKRVLNPIMNRYDYIIIDSGRSLGNLYKNLLKVGDSVIIPIEPCGYSVDGIPQLLERIEKSKKTYDNGIACLGIVINLFDTRTNIDSHVKSEVEQKYPKLLCKTIVPRVVQVKYSAMASMAVNEYEEKSKIAEILRSLTEELMTRLEV